MTFPIPLYEFIRLTIYSGEISVRPERTRETPFQGRSHTTLLGK